MSQWKNHRCKKKKQFTATEQSHCYYYQKHPGFCYCDESKYLLGKRLIMLNLNVPNYMTLHIKGYFDWTVKKCGEQRFDYPSGWCATFPWITNAVTFALHVLYSLACLYAL